MASAQEMPSGYKTVLTVLGKDGDFKDGVLKVNIPRNDLRVTIKQRPAPTSFGFGGWIALSNGLDVTALHNHFFWEQPSTAT